MVIFVQTSGMVQNHRFSDAKCSSRKSPHTGINPTSLAGHATCAFLSLFLNPVLGTRMNHHSSLRRVKIILAYSFACKLQRISEMTTWAEPIVAKARLLVLQKLSQYCQAIHSRRTVLLQKYMFDLVHSEMPTPLGRASSQIDVAEYWMREPLVRISRTGWILVW